MCRVLPLWFMYGFMACIVPFYTISRRMESSAMYRYLRRRQHHSAPVAFFLVLASQLRFGQIIVDRFARYAGKKFNITIDGFDEFLKMSAGKEGFVQLSSHVGNYEMAGYCLPADHKQMNALVFAGETEVVMSHKQRTLLGNNIRLIPMSEDMSHIFTLNNALADGEIVSMPGDRIFGSQKCLECDFLGARADFPLGPFALAVQRGVKVLAVFCMKSGYSSYHVMCVPLALTPGQQNLNARAKMSALAQMFADELSRVVRLYPLQWFNYYDFWKD